MVKCEICGTDVTQRELKGHLRNCFNTLKSDSIFEGLSNFEHTLEALEFLKYRRDLDRDFMYSLISVIFERHAEELSDNNYDITSIFSHVRQLGEFGIRFLIKIYISLEDWYVQENLLDYLINKITEENEIEVLREEIVNYFCKLDYPKIMLLFEDETTQRKTLLHFLQEIDYKKMLNTPNSDIIEKFITVIQNERDPPDAIEDIISFLGPRRVELYLFYIRKADEITFEPFREMGKDIFEPFLKDVIFNENHYKYYGEDSRGETTLEELYKIFFDSMTKEELTEFLVDKNVIERLIEIENQDHFYDWRHAHNIQYFLYHLFLRIDNDTILRIYYQLPDKLKNGIHDLFAEEILESTDMDEFWIMRDHSNLEESKRIFPLLSTKEDILNIIHILATEHRIIYMDALKKILTDTDFSNVNYHELLNIVNKFLTLVNERKTYECSEGKLILPKFFLREIMNELQNGFLYVITSISSFDTSTGIKRLAEFLNIVFLIAEEVFYLVETYISEGHAFNIGEPMDFEVTEQVIGDYFDSAFDTIVSLEDDQRIIKVNRYFSTAEERIETFRLD